MSQRITRSKTRHQDPAEEEEQKINYPNSFPNLTDLADKKITFVICPNLTTSSKFNWQSLRIFQLVFEDGIKDCNFPLNNIPLNVNKIHFFLKTWKSKT